jgi:transketolase
VDTQRPPARPASETDTALTWRSINTIRALAMDAVQAAESGHPGTPMALAPAA